MVPRACLGRNNNGGAAVYTLMVLYPMPKDPEHFRDYYVNTHVPLATKMPGLRAQRYSIDLKAFNGDAPYFCVWEGDFDDAKAMGAALQSPEGQAVAADLPNYASGGATMVHFARREG